MRQHYKKAHPAEYNEADIALMNERSETKKGRYTKQEMTSIARFELSLPDATKASTTAICSALAPLAKRSADGLKKMRQKQEYKDILAQLLIPPEPPTEAKGDESPEKTRQSLPPAENEPEPEICHHAPYLNLTKVDAPSGLVQNGQVALFLRQIQDQVTDELADIIQTALEAKEPDQYLLKLDTKILSIHIPEEEKQARKPKRKRKNKKIQRKGNRSKRRAAEYAKTQSLYAKNPGQVAAALLKGQEVEVNEHPTAEKIEEFFSKTYSKIQPTWQPQEPGPVQVDTSQPISKEEMIRALRKLNESAAGPDGINRKDLRRMNHSELLAILNLIWGTCLLPPILRANRTVLLPKSGDLKDPKNWRPITISSRLLRLLQQIISKRLEKNLPLAYSQRGFTSQDGVLINNTVLQATIKTYRTNGQPLIVLSLDLAKAFDRVTIESITNALRKRGLDQHTIKYILANYTAITTVLECHGIRTNQICLLRGTKQGDPMSGFLFNLIIDDLLILLEKHPGVKIGESTTKALAFADDIVMLATDIHAMEEMIRTAQAFFIHHNLDVNVEKCAALQLLRVPGTKRICVQTKSILKFDGKNIPTIATEDQFKYLGHQYTHIGIRCPSLTKLDTMLQSVEKACLKPWQKLQIIQRYLIPALYHGLQYLGITSGHLKTYDQKLKAAVKRILKLPKTTPDICIHAPLKLGGLAIPSIRIQVAATYQRRLQKLLMNGAPDIEAALSTPVVQTTMSRMGNILKPLNGNQANHVRSYYRDQIAKCALMKGFLQVEVPSQYVYQPPFFWKYGEYIRAIHLRFGLLPTLSRPWDRKECRNPSCADQENLYHILQRCPVTHYARINRHDNINKMLVNSIAENTGIFEEAPNIKGVEAPTNGGLPQGCLHHNNNLYKPDIIIKTPESIVVADTTIAFESYVHSMQSAYAHKVNKYTQPDFLNGVRRKYGRDNIITLPLVVGARGTWHPLNNSLMNLLGINSNFKNLCTNAVLQWGSSIHRIYNATTWRAGPTPHPKTTRKKRSAT